MSRTVAFIRETIKAAGPAITESLLANISQAANDIYAEIVDDQKLTAGTLATPDISLVQTIDDGNVIAGEGKDMTMWMFTWRAPLAGRGALTLHLAMVDGNGAASASVPQNDPGGDDVAVAKLRLCETAAGCAGVAGSTA